MRRRRRPLSFNELLRASYDPSRGRQMLDSVEASVQPGHDARRPIIATFDARLSKPDYYTPYGPKKE